MNLGDDEYEEDDPAAFGSKTLLPVGMSISSASLADGFDVHRWDADADVEANEGMNCASCSIGREVSGAVSMSATVFLLCKL